ncbi:MAG: PQQ-binding-like beta-propeller repeat protein [Candidatus Bathyarchaeia archaeon]
MSVLKISLCLMIVISLLTVSVSNVSAAEIATYLFIVARPNPIGVDQTLLITWIFHMPPPTGARWENVTITVTTPDGTTETKGPFKSDIVGCNWLEYVPKKVGKYYFQANFPGQTIGSNYYKPSTSRKLEIIVQQEPVPYFPETPLPTDYWRRPIDAQYREWSSISGNWLTGMYNITGIAANAFNPYTTAPGAPHIMWTKPIDFGGLIGGEFGSMGYYEGLSYEDKWSPVVIIQGRLYYNTRLSSSLWEGVACVDVRTGEELWWKNNTVISLGQVFVYESINQHGGIAYLWDLGVSEANVYKLYDAFTGNKILQLSNASTGQFLFGPHGELLAYVLNAARRWMVLWNSTTCFNNNGLITYQSQAARELGVYGGQLRLQRGTYDWRKGVDWNVTISGPSGQSIVGTNGEVVLATATITSATGETNLAHIGYDAKTGRQMWIYNYSVASSAPSFDFCTIGEGVYVFHQKETLQEHVYDLYTGQKLFSTDPGPTDWNCFYVETVIAYGKLFVGDMGGYVRAYDLKTGRKLWEYYSGSSGFETPYGSWPIWGTAGARSPEYTPTYALVVADHKVFISTSEHSPTQPLYRGGRLIAIDAETGKEIWSISGWMRDPAIADGYILTLNSYDNRIYSFGKGPSSVSVEAPSTGVSLGSTVVIRGKVLDESPGQKGTPCVAKESMSAWMEYLHMQKPVPAEVKGVPVELYAIYPDGSYRYVDTVTTNPLAGGIYGLAWAPPQEGTYTIIAVFKGDESYGSSTAGTVIHVTPAPPAGPAPATAEQVAEQAETMQSTIQSLQPWNIALTVLVAIAIAIGILNLYALRKRK